MKSIAAELIQDGKANNGKDNRKLSEKIMPSDKDQDGM